MTCKLIPKIFSVQRRLAGRTDRGAGQHKITSRAALFSKFLRSRGPHKITSRAAFGPWAAGCTGLGYGILRIEKEDKNIGRKEGRNGGRKERRNKGGREEVTVGEEFTGSSDGHGWFC